MSIILYMIFFFYLFSMLGWTVNIYWKVFLQSDLQHYCKHWNAKIYLNTYKKILFLLHEMLLLAQSKSLRIVTINLYIYYLSENWIILWTYINKNKFKFVHFSLMSYGRNTVGAEWRDFKRTTFIRIVSEERHTPTTGIAKLQNITLCIKFSRYSPINIPLSI